MERLDQQITECLDEPITTLINPSSDDDDSQVAVETLQSSK